PARRIRRHPRAAPADAEHRADRGSREERPIGHPRRRDRGKRGHAAAAARPAALTGQRRYFDVFTLGSDAVAPGTSFFSSDSAAVIGASPSSTSPALLPASPSPSPRRWPG